MSKSEEKTATGDARNQNLQFNKNAQSSYKAAEGDVGDYAGQLAKFAAANPFVQGGQYDRATTQEAADAAASGAQSAGQAMQAASVRSGMNPAAGIAATEQVAEANNRNDAAQRAAQTQQRLGLLAGYNQNVLNATAVPEQMEQGLTSTEAGAGTGTLGQEVDAAKTPSYLDQLVSGSIAAGDAFAGKHCWVAAVLWGGWSDSRVVLVRLWLAHSFSHRWYGGPPCWLYGRYGERMAYEWMPKSPRLEKAMRWVFGHALRAAHRWERRDERAGAALTDCITFDQAYQRHFGDEKRRADYAMFHAGRHF